MQNSLADLSEGMRLPANKLLPRTIEFMETVVKISGLGDRTFLPDGAAVHGLQSDILLEIECGREE